MSPMAARLILALACATLVTTPARAADIFWTDPLEATFRHVYPAETIGDPIAAGDVKSFAAAPHLRVEGPIEPGDADRLRDLLNAQKPDWTVDMFKEVVVSFDSDGGDFYEGLAMADAVSDLAVSTVVGPGDRCLSSCAVAFLGGSSIALRGFPSWPSRFIHVDGMLGYHAPFSEVPAAIQIPDGTPLTESLTRQMAQSFYGQAQAAINEIAGRMSEWQISPDFVFDMLTMDSYAGDTRPMQARFVLVDSYHRSRQIRANVLTSALTYPTEITGIGAAAACTFLVEANTGRAPHGINIAPPVGARAQEAAHRRFPEIVSERGAVATIRRLVPGNDPEAFFTQGILPGLGPFQCGVYRGEDGRWYARSFNENIHHPSAGGTYVRGRGADLVEVDVLDFEKGYPVSRYILLGATGSWLHAPLLGAPFQDRLPEWTREIEGASFDCGGTLDPAAQVICENPALADADGRLGALYQRARAQNGDAVRAEQRAWVAERDASCRADRVDLDDDIIRWNLALCLMRMTSARNSALARQLQ